MKKSEIEKLHNQLVTEEIMDAIMYSQDVLIVDNCGLSSQYPGAIWYDVQFGDGTSIDIFYKN